VKKNPTTQPTRGQFSLLRQICNFIPAHLVAKLAREKGVEAKARTFTPWSHVVALLYAQLTHALSLNDVCDGLQLNRGALAGVRGATAPCRNTFSHANKGRDAGMAEALFWKVLGHLGTLSPNFYGRKARGGGKLAWRFRRTIQIVDATVIQLVANCLDWAKHRRRKAAAKCHLRLDLQSMLPRFAIIDVAREHDITRAPELCAGLRAGEIVIMDRGYVDFVHLALLDERGVFFVVRAKKNLAYEVKSTLSAPKGSILADEEIELSDPATRQHAPKRLRRVVALVEVDGKEMEMVFLTNNLTWAASSVADLYRCRWQIEVFFKQIKQTLQVGDFLGHNANAVRWQLWTALLSYVLLRYAGFISRWAHGFSRLWAVLRSALWQRRNLRALLESYGTASGSFRCLAQPEQAYFPAFRRAPVGQHR
jgi:hypothetical protein